MTTIEFLHEHFFGICVTLILIFCSWAEAYGKRRGDE